MIDGGGDGRFVCFSGVRRGSYEGGDSSMKFTSPVCPRTGNGNYWSHGADKEYVNEKPS